MKQSPQKIKESLFIIGRYVQTHSKVALVLGLLLVGMGAYFIFNSKEGTVTTTIQKSKVTRKDISVSVSGSGSISPSNTVDLKVKGSGDVRSIGIKTGQTVVRGSTLISLDGADAYQAVATAKVNLQTAELELEKIKKPPQTIEVLQLENQIAEAKQKINDQDTLVANAYTSYLSSSLEAIPEVQSTTFTPPTISGSYTSKKEGSIKIVPYLSGDGLRFSYSGLVSGDGLASLGTPQALADSGLYIKFSSLEGQPNWIINIPNKRSSSYASSYTSYQNALTTREKTIAEQNRTLAELNEKLKDLQDGADPLDVRAKELVVAQRKNDLNEAYAKLSNYIVAAPFDGIIASVVAEVGDSVTPSTVLGTIITKKKIATISLNEADISKVVVGQKAELTFDALDSTKVEGEVSEIDTLGTTSSGVVTYTVKITFDDKDVNIKPGMTVTADIVLEQKSNTIVIATEAIKTVKGKKFVLLENKDGSQRQTEVVTGISNETEREVVSGVEEGETVLVERKTSTVKATSQNTSLMSFPRGSGARPF